MESSLTRETAKAAATKMVAMLRAPENAQKITAVRNECAGDIGKFYMMCIPVVTAMCGQVLVEYGYEASASGVMKFVAELQQFLDDPELKKYSEELKSQFMPVPLPSPAADEAAD